ncbi:unnamed protein product [Gadus morhua 'NCC']
MTRWFELAEEEEVLENEVMELMKEELEWKKKNNKGKISPLPTTGGTTTTSTTTSTSTSTSPSLGAGGRDG